MKLTIENRLDICAHVTAIRHGAKDVTLVFSSARRMTLVGEVLRYECLFPGTALALRNFDERTLFNVSIEGFNGEAIEMEVGKEADDPDAMLVILRGRKMALD